MCSVFGNKQSEQKFDFTKESYNGMESSEQNCWNPNIGETKQKIRGYITNDTWISWDTTDW